MLLSKMDASFVVNAADLSHNLSLDKTSHSNIPNSLQSQSLVNISSLSRQAVSSNKLVTSLVEQAYFKQFVASKENQRIYREEQKQRLAVSSIRLNHELQARSWARMVAQYNLARQQMIASINQLSLKVKMTQVSATKFPVILSNQWSSFTKINTPVIALSPSNRPDSNISKRLLSIALKEQEQKIQRVHTIIPLSQKRNRNERNKRRKNRLFRRIFSRLYE